MPTRPATTPAQDARHRQALGWCSLRQTGKTLVALLVLLVATTVLAGGLFALNTKAQAGDYRQAMAVGDYASAAHWAEQDANEGDPRALTALGNLHYLGLGVRQDHRTAAQHYFAAAKIGYAPAQMNLGHMYGQGLGVAQNPLRAFGWYHHADVAGSEVAEYYLYQIRTEYALSPLQRSTAVQSWRTLADLVAEGL